MIEALARRLAVPLPAVADALEVARETGSTVRRQPSEIVDNRFAEHLDTSGFLRQLWGRELPRGK